MAAPTTATVEFLKNAYGSKLKSTKNNVTLQHGKGVTVTGASSIAKNLQKELYAGLSLEDRMSVEQWLDYSCEIAALENAGDREKMNSVLKDLNTFVKDKVYFAGSDLSVADVFLCHSLFPVFKKLTFQEKEKLGHLSRWFNHVQSDKTARQSLMPVVFIRNLLYNGVGDH